MTENDSWMEPESIWDIRRKAPFHFESKANNARMSAYVLSHVGETSAADFASGAGYPGIPGRIKSVWVAGCYRNRWPDDPGIRIYWPLKTN